MKKLIILICLFCHPVPSFAQDHLVEFFAEVYKEKMILGGGEYKIYHTWQVKTEYGNKNLILIGDDHNYRQWLRTLLKSHKSFVVKIPSSGEKTFKYNMAVFIDVIQVHPVKDPAWICEKCKGGLPPSPPASELDSN